MTNKKIVVKLVTKVSIKIYEHEDGTRQMIYKFEPPLSPENELGQEILAKLRMIAYERSTSI